MKACLSQGVAFSVVLVWSSCGYDGPRPTLVLSDQSLLAACQAAGENGMSREQCTIALSSTETAVVAEPMAVPIVPGGSKEGNVGPLAATATNKTCSTGNGTFSGVCNASENPNIANKDQGGTEQCALWLAESSIPNSGLGVYSGISIPEGSTVYQPDIMIPIFEGGWQTWKMWHDYTWDLSHGHILDSYSSSHICPGVLAHINCHMGLVNVEIGDFQTNTAGLHRSKDAGAGAFSIYHDMFARSINNIQAGSELFVSYGNHWFESREESIGKVPFLEHFEKANAILQKTLRLPQEHVTEELWNKLRGRETERVQMALPKFVKDIDHAATIGAAQFSLPNSIRSQEWLSQNGICIDKLRMGQSKIGQAGRGAFAKRALTQGEVIAPSPIVHLNRTTILNYHHRDVEEEIISSRISKQLLFNYAFGHANSSIILVPYAPMVNYINHDAKEPNAYIRWSSSNIQQHADWLSVSSSTLVQEFKKPGLMIEYVALRDIHPNEEILLDYGKEWNTAWNQHLSSWTPPQPPPGSSSSSSSSSSSADTSDRYILAEEFIWKYYQNGIRTVQEQELDPYPDSVDTICYYYAPEEEDDGIVVPVNRTINEKGIKIITSPWNEGNLGWCQRKCKILSKTVIIVKGKNVALYTAEMLEPTIVRNEEVDLSCDIPMKEQHFVTHIPRWAITLSSPPISFDDDDGVGKKKKDDGIGNVREEALDVILTSKEQELNPYPLNIKTACCYYHAGWHDDSFKQVGEGEEGDYYQQWEVREEWKSYHDEQCIRYCQVVSREVINGVDYYTAVMSSKSKDNQYEYEVPSCSLPNNEIHIVSRIPRHGITFMDDVFSTDIHIPSAFRHVMGTPEGFFPLAWMDLEGSTNGNWMDLLDVRDAPEEEQEEEEGEHEDEET